MREDLYFVALTYLSGSFVFHWLCRNMDRSVDKKYESRIIPVSVLYLV